MLLRAFTNIGEVIVW